ncbi:hypothetical protein BKA65DRAFT_554691 [Rhexocercosporidium sp. MPI-PUGE-AT-0058]|nr:hypothetical protein BKA65DRAFT_554691 [Rhexocercosporidium sp. MPI-PUGE-AT-0058]
MLFSRILLTSSLAAFGLSYVIPAGQSDGLYEVFLDEHGLEVHRPLSVTSVEERSTLDVGVLGKRGRFPNTDLTPMERPKLRCGCGFHMDHGGCNDAVAELRNQFGRSLGASIPAGNAWYSIRSNVVAFTCAPRSMTGFWPITEESFDHFYISTGWISQDCGSFVAGTVAEVDGGPRHGYMIHYPGLDFCGNAMGSRLDHC